MYQHEQAREASERAMQRQAWYSMLCSFNRPIYGQREYKWNTFYDFFPPPKTPDEIEIDEEKIKEACTAHKIRPPTRF